MALTVKGPGGGSSKFPTGIYVKTPPAKVSYTAGETLSAAGIVVVATWSNNTETDITAECSFSPAEGTALYENSTSFDITWEWKHNIVYSCKQEISVARVLDSIAVTTNPTKTTYYKDETLDLSGLKVTATFTSGLTEDVTGSCSSSPAAGSALSSYGDVAVTVSYAENGVTKTASFSVTVTVKIVTWAGGTDAEIANMVAAADAGVINLQDYWAVGQERSVSLAAMAATGVGESHSAQNVTMVLMNKGGKTLANGKTCSFIVGLKNGLATTGYMNSTNTNSGGWESCARRTWCNNVFRNAIPSALRGIFKQHKNVTANGSSTGTTTSTDYFALPAEKEVFGSVTYANATAETSLTQFEYYKTTANRVKNAGDSGSASGWWERSPNSGNSTRFCSVYSGGSAGGNNAGYAHLLAPFGCI